MIDINKVDTNVKLEIILLWLKSLVRKGSLSNHDKDVISSIAIYLIMEEFK